MPGAIDTTYQTPFHFFSQMTLVTSVCSREVH